MTIVEAPARDQEIAAVPRPVAAFLGRCLAGPVNTAVRIDGMSAFERRFGGRWRESSLADQLAQFFQHGGTEAWVVRVVNNATAGSVELTAASGQVRLAAVNPGSGETLRVSVDYDGLDGHDDLANLTVQRLDNARRHVSDQEIFRAVSTDPAHERFIGRLLRDASLVTLASLEPDCGRLQRTVSGLTGERASYVPMLQPGSDGAPLSDYDYIGSAVDATALFALDSVEHFDFLYACGARGLADTGAAFYFAAHQYCESRNAMLVLDPPSRCRDAREVIAARRRAQFDGASLLTYFPPLYHRHDSEQATCSAAGALMGLLSRQDRDAAVWQSLADNVRQNSAALHRDWQPKLPLDSDAALDLLQAGVNPILLGSQRRLLFPGLVTAANRRDRALGSLTQQRLIKFVLRHVARGTRWAVFETADAALWARVEEQVGAFLASLDAEGAFAPAAHGASWSVRCDASTNDGVSAGTALRLLLAFRARGARQPSMYSVVQRKDGTSVCRTAFVYE